MARRREKRLSVGARTGRSGLTISPRTSVQPSVQHTPPIRRGLRKVGNIGQAGAQRVGNIGRAGAQSVWGGGRVRAKSVGGHKQAIGACNASPHDHLALPRPLVHSRCRPHAPHASLRLSSPFHRARRSRDPATRRAHTMRALPKRAPIYERPLCGVGPGTRAPNSTVNEARRQHDARRQSHRPTPYTHFTAWCCTLVRSTC